MRCYILLLVGAFAVAVMAPNKIGTQDLPAVGCKVFTKVVSESAQPCTVGAIFAFVPVHGPCVDNLEGLRVATGERGGNARPGSRLLI